MSDAVDDGIMNGDAFMNDDTIAALATPVGVGAIAVIRVSGKGAASVIDRVFVPKGNRARRGKEAEQAEGLPLPAYTMPSHTMTSHTMPSHTMCYGSIVDADGSVVDEVMCTIMYAPRSYTREDLAEVYCHGGPLTAISVLSAIYAAGARPAEPGEFTKRAFLNGRIDLSQAEAVMELINAKTDLARRAVLRKLSGGLSHKIAGYRDRILRWLAHIEVSVDYPEHEEEAINLAMIREEGLALLSEIANLAATARIGDRIKMGVPTVIVGRPNVGKSSLMNAILQQDRAIVTDVPGTTRDTLTEMVTIQNVPILLTDTAGIREGIFDKAESIGVERSVRSARTAELILHVIDRSKPVTDEDLAVGRLIEEEMIEGIKSFTGQKRIIVLNKSDLPSALPSAVAVLQTEGVCDACDTYCGIYCDAYVEVSAKTGEGLSELYRLVEEMFIEGELSAEDDIITEARHRFLLDGAIKHLRGALTDIDNNVPEDIVSIDLKSAYILLGEMIGEAVADDVLDRIFSEFCLGK